MSFSVTLIKRGKFTRAISGTPRFVHRNASWACTFWQTSSRGTVPSILLLISTVPSILLLIIVESDVHSHGTLVRMKSWCFGRFAHDPIGVHSVSVIQNHGAVLSFLWSRSSMLFILGVVSQGFGVTARCYLTRFFRCTCARDLSYLSLGYLR